MTSLLLDQVVIFALILTRLSGLIMVAPGYGSGYAPPQVRILLAVGLSLLILPVHWGQPAPEVGTLLELTLMIGREALLGVAIGMTILILVSGLHLAGQMMSQVGGMQMADLFDPTFEGTMPIFAKLLEMTAMAVLFISGGHRQILEALLTSFRYVPPGHAQWTENYTTIMSEVARQSFEVGLRASAPVVISVLLAVLIMGLVSRTLPQLNILAVGFSLNALVLLGVFALSIGASTWVFHETASGVLDALQRLLLDPAELFPTS